MKEEQSKIQTFQQQAETERQRAEISEQRAEKLAQLLREMGVNPEAL